MALNKKSGQSSGNSTQTTNLVIRAKDEGSQQIAAIGKRLGELKINADSASQSFNNLAQKIQQSSAPALAAIGAIGFAVKGVYDTINSAEGMAFFEAIEAGAKESLESVARFSDTIRAGQQIGTPLVEGFLFGKGGRQTAQKLKEEAREIGKVVEEIGKRSGQRAIGQGVADGIRNSVASGRKAFDELRASATRTADSVSSRVTPAIERSFDSVSRAGVRARAQLAEVARSADEVRARVTANVNDRVVQARTTAQENFLRAQTVAQERFAQARVAAQERLAQARASIEGRLAQGAGGEQLSLDLGVPQPSIRETIVANARSTLSNLRETGQQALAGARERVANLRDGSQQLSLDLEAEPPNRAIESARKTLSSLREAGQQALAGARERIASLRGEEQQQLDLDLGIPQSNSAIDAARKSLEGLREAGQRALARVQEVMAEVSAPAEADNGVEQLALSFGEVEAGAEGADKAKSSIQNLAQEAKKASAEVGARLKSSIEDVAKRLEGTSIEGLMDSGKKAWETFSEGFKEKAGQADRALGTAISQAISGPTQDDQGGQLSLDLGDAQPQQDASALELAKQALETLKTRFQEVQENAKDFFETLRAGSGENSGVEQLALDFEAVSDSAQSKSGLKGAIEASRDAISKTATAVKTALGPALEKLPLDQLSKKFNSIVSSDTVKAGKEAWEKFSGSFRDTAASAASAVRAQVAAVLAPREQQLQDSQQGITDAGDEALDAAGEAAQRASENFDKLLAKADFVDQKFRELSENIGNVVKAATGGLSGLSQGVGLVAGAGEPLELFSLMKQGTSSAIEAVSNVSQEIFFMGGALQQLQSIVVGGPYDILIGQNVRLQEQLLSTKASIAANNKVLQDGITIEDPGKAIDALNAPIDAAISQIRKDSLELVGVTSKDLVEVFNIISQQISNVNLDLGEAADLTISFAAGLGTIGLPLDQARQEIQSIMTGTIDMNSVLAKSLGITNAQLKTWIAQDVVYERLNSRLASFVSGNQKAAQTIGGVSSNIQEVFDEITREAGEPFLDPIVEGVDAVYQFLSENQQFLSNTVSDYLDRIRVAATSAIEAFLALGERSGPTLIGIARLIGDSLVSAVQGLGDGIKVTTALLGPFLDILGAIASAVGSSPFLSLFVQVKVLETAFGSLVAVAAPLSKAIPLVGEAMLFTQIRGNALVNTVANLSKSWGLFASSLLLGGKYLDKIPGGMNAATSAITQFFGRMEAGALPTQLGAIGTALNGLGTQFPIVARFGQFFAGSISAMIPSLAGATVSILGFAQSMGIGKDELSGLLGAVPNLISGLGNTVGKAKIFGIELTGIGEKINQLAGIVDQKMGKPAEALDKLNEAANGVLTGIGDQVRQQAIRYGIWGTSILAVASALGGLLAQNETFKYVLTVIAEKIAEFGTAITEKLLHPVSLATIATIGLTTAIGTGLATELGRMAVQMGRVIATEAPLFFRDMAKGLQLFNAALMANTSPMQLFRDLMEKRPATFGELELAEPPVPEAKPAPEVAPPATFGEVDLEPPQTFGDVELEGEKEGPQTLGDVDIESEDEEARRKERERKLEEQERRKERRAKARSRLEGKVAPERIEELLDLSEAQAEAAKTSGQFEQGMIGSRQATTATSKSTATAATSTTALGNAQAFVTKTAATLSATMKALVVTLGPIVGIVALFSAWGYAIDQVTKASQIQKEMQEELLKVLKEQEVTIAKIQSLQGKQVENPLLEQITESDLKTDEERRAFKEGGAEQVLALRRVRDLNDEGKKKSPIRRFGEQALDVVGQSVSKLDLALREATGDFDRTSLLEGLPGIGETGAQRRERLKDATVSTTSSRRLEAEKIAGAETLTDAGTFLQQSQSTTGAAISGLMKQAQETERLLTEARAKGLEARSRELEEKLEQEQETYKKAQDEILDYATALEGTKFATSAQQEDALGIATALRKVVSDLEEEITVTGVDFARLGTSFEQLRVESENALAFFKKGEGNPEQVKQRAGQLLSSTQQLFEDSFISSEQALANYAVLFQRNSALELDDQEKLQEAILAARQKQVEGAVKLEEAKVAKLAQLAAEGGVGQFESELGNLELERQKAEIQLKGLRTSYEEQNRLRVARFQDASGQIGADLSRSQRELAIGTNPAIAAKAQADVNRLMAERLSLEDKLAAAEVGRNNAAIGAIEQRRAAVQTELEAAEKTLAGTNIGGEAADALQTEIVGYQEQLASLGESFRNQQRSANRNFVTEEAQLLAQLAESQNQELELRLKELQDRANSALDESMAKRKAQLQELRKAGIVSEEQQNLAVAKLQEDRIQQDLALERRRLREYMANPKRFEREIRESNTRIAQLTLERFEAERNSWEQQLALFQTYVDDQAEAAKNAIEIENQELIKQSKLYEAISQAISARNELLGKAKDFTQATGSAVADTLERIAKLTGNEVLQADLATSAAIIRRDTLAKQLEIQSKIFEIEQKQAEIALIRREAENAIALAKAKQQILSAQGAVVVAEQQFKRGDITEAELTGKRLELLGAVTDYQGLELERNVIAQERQLQPVLQELLRQQQQQEAQAQLDAADIAVLETFPQGLSAEADVDMAIRLGERLGIKATDMKDLAEQIRGVRGELQSGYAQEIYGDPNIFADDIGFREAQMQAGPGYRNIERLKAQGIDLGFYSELDEITASPIASVPVVENGERFLDRGTSGRASAGAFDEQTGPLLDILSGVETATAGMDESIAGLEESFSSVSLENLQSVLPEIVGRDALIDATFEGSGNVEAAINEGLALSNETLETITDGLEPLAEVRDFLGEDGPLKMSLDNLNLEPYLGENAELLRTTTSIASGVEAIVAALPGAIAPAAAPAAEAATEESTQPKRDDPPLRQREINSFIRQFETLISKDALEKARSRESESGRRVTEAELRDLITSSISPFRLEGSKLNLETASTGQILEAFRTAVADTQTETVGRGGRGGRTRTTYEIKPNLTFNVQGNPDERTIAREAVRQFETILNRAIAQG